MRKKYNYKNKKHKNKHTIQRLIIFDLNEYLDERYELLCGCNCCICNPYYGDFWEYFIQQDEREFH